jgi:hypothetical protein
MPNRQYDADRGYNREYLEKGLSPRKRDEMIVYYRNRKMSLRGIGKLVGMTPEGVRKAIIRIAEKGVGTGQYERWLSVQLPPPDDEIEFLVDLVRRSFTAPPDRERRQPQDEWRLSTICLHDGCYEAAYALDSCRRHYMADRRDRLLRENPNYREVERARGRRHYANHREACRQRSTDYYYANREEVLERKRQRHRGQ